MNSPGLFISVEGGEGSGKSTLIHRLVEYLQAENISFVNTREPGGSSISEEIRNIVVQGRGDKLDALTEALLFNAARRDHLQTTIIPALKAGKVVLCDRFFDSTLVYQGYVQNVDISLLKTLHSQVCYDILPNITYLLDVPTEVGLYRANKRKYNMNENRFEEKGFQFHEKVRNSFLELANEHKDRVHLIDATQTEVSIYNSVLNHLSQFLVKQHQNQSIG